LMEDEPVLSTLTVDTKEEPAPTVKLDDDAEETLDYFQKLADAS
jgi:hypothetical protein